MKVSLSKILIFLFILFAFETQAQVLDTVIMGPGYANSIYYLFGPQAIKTPYPVKNWDLAFQSGIMSDGVMINSSNGVRLFMVPNTDTTGWSNLDTAGFESWPEYYNTDTSWDKGAFNRSEPTNVYTSWGHYNTSTHILTGDSLYLLKMTSGTTTIYKKLWLVEKNFGSYTFRYADLDNSNDTTITLDSGSALFKDVQYGYYSIRNNTAIINEPVTNRWDIVFTRYWALVSGGPTPYYQVTGVLSKAGVQVAEARGVDPATAKAFDYKDNYSNNISEFGYDWKTAPAGPFPWTIDSMLCFFVKAQNGNIYKVKAISFGGSADGMTTFLRTDFGTSINENMANPVGSMVVYPNPASGTATLLLSAHLSGSAVVNILDMSGRIQYTKNISLNSNQLLQEELNLDGFSTGLYFVSVVADGYATQQKLMIR